ncbi:MAG TPA: hypothetical protein VIF62_20455 [Labilithrix sp.]|jgi:hypothetical protein
MRTHAAILSLVASIAAASAASCASSEPNVDAPPAATSAPTLPAPDAGTIDAGTHDASSPPPPPTKDCSLEAVTGLPDVPASFVLAAPPAMTGGTLDGEYGVEKVTVYLPTGLAGVVDTKASTGTVSAWAVFKGSRYRLHLKADFAIATSFGPQTQSIDTESQGGFTTNAATLLLDHECDTAIADEADYAFTDDGSGRATLLVKSSSPYGDVYMAMDAIK